MDARVVRKKKKAKKKGSGENLCCDESERIGRQKGEGERGKGGRVKGRARGREDDRMAWASFLERESVPCWETTTKLGEKRTGDLYK